MTKQEEIFQFPSPQAGISLKEWRVYDSCFRGVKVSVPSSGDKSQRAELESLDIIGLICHFATELGKYIHLDALEGIKSALRPCAVYCDGVHIFGL